MNVLRTSQPIGTVLQEGLPLRDACQKVAELFKTPGETRNFVLRRASWDGEHFVEFGVGVTTRDKVLELNIDPDFYVVHETPPAKNFKTTPPLLILVPRPDMHYSWFFNESSRYKPDTESLLATDWQLILIEK